MSGPRPAQQRLRVFERPYSDQDDPRRLLAAPSLERFVARLESPQAVRFAGDRGGLQIFLGRDGDELFSSSDRGSWWRRLRSAILDSRDLRSRLPDVVGWV